MKQKLNGNIRLPLIAYKLEQKQRRQAKFRTHVETLREVKAGQNAAYTAVESAAGFQYDALHLRQQRVLPKW